MTILKILGHFRTKSKFYDFLWFYDVWDPCLRRIICGCQKCEQSHCHRKKSSIHPTTLSLEGLDTLKYHTFFEDILRIFENPHGTLETSDHILRNRALHCKLRGARENSTPHSSPFWRWRSMRQLLFCLQRSALQLNFYNRCAPHDPALFSKSLRGPAPLNPSQLLLPPAGLRPLILCLKSLWTWTDFNCVSVVSHTMFRHFLHFCFTGK